MAHLSTIQEAHMLAADAVVMLRDIRQARDRNELERIATAVLGNLRSRHTCRQIMNHFECAIAEERMRRAEPASRKMQAAGRDE